MQKKKFVEGQIYHAFNKSIANFGIFKDLNNAEKFIKTLSYYNNKFIEMSLSKYLERHKDDIDLNLLLPKKYSYVKFISYCMMPDHYHLLVKVLTDSYLSKYISDVENSFTRYFNIKFERKGPLWQSRFKSVRIKTNEQLLHVSRYIHLNPTTSYLVENPGDWQFSSYREIISNNSLLKNTLTEISISNALNYKKFVNDQIDYQRKLKVIKKLILE